MKLSFLGRKQLGLVMFFVAIFLGISSTAKVLALDYNNDAQLLVQCPILYTLDDPNGLGTDFCSVVLYCENNAPKTVLQKVNTCYTITINGYFCEGESIAEGRDIAYCTGMGLDGEQTRTNYCCYYGEEYIEVVSPDDPGDGGDPGMQNIATCRDDADYQDWLNSNVLAIEYLP